MSGKVRELYGCLSSPSSHPLISQQTRADESSGDYMCSVYFGPGARELLTANPHLERNLNVEQTRDPLGFLAVSDPPSNGNVASESPFDPKLQSKIQSCSKIFRYICRYCSSKCSSKILLQIHHQKKHNFVCHCGEKFVKKNDLIKHKRTHNKSASKSYACSVCNYKTLSLDLLPIHEMKHRLNSCFMMKVEREVGKNRSVCSTCQRSFKGVSHLIRHEVWHEWSRIWNNYVMSKAFRLKVQESEIRKMEDAVKKAYEDKWNGISIDCQMLNKSNPSTSSVLSNRSKTPIIKKKNNGASQILKIERRAKTNESRPSIPRKHTASKAQVKIAKIAKQPIKRSTKSPSSPQESVGIDEVEWMNYWRSYIGLNDDNAVPTWAQDVLEGLHSKFRYFHPNHQEDLYRGMDQISFLVRAHKGEESHLNGVRVMISKLPPLLLGNSVCPSSCSVSPSPTSSPPCANPSAPQSSSFETETPSKIQPPSCSFLKESPQYQWLVPRVVLSRLIPPECTRNVASSSETSNLLFESSFLEGELTNLPIPPQMQSWFKKQIAGLVLPDWARMLLHKVSRGRNQSHSQMRRNLFQIVALVHANSKELNPSASVSPIRGAYVRLVRPIS